MPASIKSMRYFVAAVSHGNISRAASELNVAASAVAAAIDQIEAQFQLKLVNRHRSRGIAPTASGRTLLRKFSRLLEDYDAVMLEGSELKHALQGELRIGYYTPVAPAFLPDILSGLSGLENQITYHLEECDNNHAQAGLLAGELDVILFVSDAARPQVEFDVLIEAPAYCLAPSDHPLAQKPAIWLSELANEPLIVLNRPVAVDYYQALFDESGQSPATLAYANSTEMVRSLVGAGQGCAVLNMLPAIDVSYAGDRLAAVQIRDTLPPLTLSVGYDKTNTRRVVAEFVNRCSAYFRKGPGHRHILTE